MYRKKRMRQGIFLQLSAWCVLQILVEVQGFGKSCGLKCCFVRQRHKSVPHQGQIHIWPVGVGIV